MKTNSEKYKAIADLFYAKRKSMGLTIMGLASLAGVDWQAVRRFEKCELRMIHPFIEKVSQALDIHIEKEDIPVLEPHKLSVPKKSEYGKKVLDTRLRLGLSQEAFGKKFGMYGNVISSIENGKYRKGRKKAPKSFEVEFEKLLVEINGK